MSRVVVTLPVEERDALVQLALAELRNPPEQARHILRQELARCGLLPSAQEPTEGDDYREGYNGQPV